VLERGADIVVKDFKTSAGGRRRLVVKGRGGGGEAFDVALTADNIVLKRQASHLIRNMIAGQEWRRRKLKYLR